MNNLTKYILGGSIAFGALALIVSGPETLRSLKPLKIGQDDRIQESPDFSVFTDKENGNIYGWIIGPGGEERFVKMDKNSENKVRMERNKELERQARQEAKESGQYVPPAPVPASNNKKDVRSGEIFEVDDVWEEFEVNARIKWRAREGQMLYRLAIKAPTKISSKDTTVECISSDKEDELLSLVDDQNNEIRLRFKDSDDFWINDFLIPLGTDKAENFVETSVDAYYKDDCDRVNQLVFHGRLEEFYLPDYTWVDDGKLIFTDVEIGKTERNKDEDD